MKPAFEDMSLQIPAATAEPEDYTGEDGLLYCGKCRTPKEAYFPADKVALFGRDRHPVLSLLFGGFTLHALRPLAVTFCRVSVTPEQGNLISREIGGRTETPGLYRPGYAGMDFCQ